MKRADDGFTLIELAISIGCAGLVTLAVITILQFTMVSVAQTRRDSVARSDIRIMTEFMNRNISNRGDIYTSDDKKAITVGPESDNSSTVILWYDEDKKTLRSGCTVSDWKTGADENKGAIVLENIDDFEATINRQLTEQMNEDPYALLICKFTVDGKEYNTSYYCRAMTPRLITPETSPGASEPPENSPSPSPSSEPGLSTPSDNSNSLLSGYDPQIRMKSLRQGGGSGKLVSEARGREALVRLAVSQYGSDGTITEDLQDGFVSYSEWYTQQKDFAGWEGWSTDTPWCACFVSWAVDMIARSGGLEGSGEVPRFADVTAGAEGFRSGRYGAWQDSGSYLPVTGDLVFFNLDGDPEIDHVGIVGGLDGDTLLTIEGNTLGRVEAMMYPAADASIVGYGVLRWPGETLAYGR